MRDVTAVYDLAAHRLVPEYERLTFEEVHAPVFDLVPNSGICVLDVGAGSGRDAAWFAARENHTVFAVEPSGALRAVGRDRHASPNIRWVEDSLPGLDKVLRSKLTFDLIWLSGVWMAHSSRCPYAGFPQAGLPDAPRRQHDDQHPPWTASP